MTTQTQLSTDLRSEITTMKQEIDALQVNVMKASRPWYQNASILIALLALIFSFGTTFVSYQRTAQLDIQNLRAELRGLIQRLVALPKENITILRDTGRNPLEVGQISSLIEQENALLARQSAAIIYQIPRHVSSSEYIAVAQAMMSSSLAADAERLMDQALANARDFNDEVVTLRMRGNLFISTGRLSEGRQSYQAALDVFTKYRAANKHLVDYTHCLTHLNWATTEAFIKDHGEAEKHFNKAEKLASSLGPQVAQLLLMQIKEARTMSTEGRNLGCPN